MQRPATTSPTHRSIGKALQQATVQVRLGPGYGVRHGPRATYMCLTPVWTSVAKSQAPMSHEPECKLDKSQLLKIETQQLTSPSLPLSTIQIRSAHGLQL